MMAIPITCTMPQWTREPVQNLVPAVRVDDVTALPPEAPRAVIRERIEALEAQMRRMPQLPIETRHYFAKGLYAREIFIPRGALLTGKIHREEHLNFISQGEISVVTEEGVKRLKAPCTIVSQPGTKRVGYAHEDTIWTTVHATEETDLEKLETKLIAPTFDDLELLGQVLKLEGEPCPG